jgi:transcriptional regulator with XRE-family HTH domain
MELQKTLKKLMQQKDINVAQLSRATKIPAQTLHNWLTGQKPRDLDQVCIVAQHFSVSLDFLLRGVEHKNSYTIDQFKNDINAGVFEVILRKP